MINPNSYYNEQIIKVLQEYREADNAKKIKMAIRKHSILRLFFSCDICLGAELAKDVVIPHAVGIVIGGTAVIKSGVVIMPNVVIGAAQYPSQDVKRHATIGKNVLLGANSTILGNIEIGDNSIIGGAVLLRRMFRKIA